MFKKLNEELEKFIVNEISDELKGRYIQRRQAQVDAALAKLNKARGQVKKSDARQIATLPQGIDKETATDALQYLKSEMRRIDSGSDWRLEEQDNEMCLSVRYWGSWHGDDGSGDYDWQTLDDQYRDKLDGILLKVQKKYGVQIYEPGSEKNWLDFCIPITKKNKDSMFSYEDEKAWKEFLDKVRGIDITGPIQKKRGPWIGKGDYSLHINPVEGGYTCFIRSPRGVYEPLRITEVCSFKDILNKVLDFYQTRVEKQKQRTGREYLGDNTYV